MSQFSINFEWLTRDFGDPIERATLAQLQIIADGCTATEVDDTLAKTVRQDIRVSAYALAQWFAFNWWRLRWEPERNTASWKMSHQIGAAGEGYLWPDLNFISHGELILLLARSSAHILKQPIRYLNDFEVFIPALEFEQVIDTFIEAVISRLTIAKRNQVEFIPFWQEVLEERHDPEIAAYRKLEAIMGFDPDDAPDNYVQSLQAEANRIGMNAVEEMAASSMEKAIADINYLLEGGKKAASLIHIPRMESIRKKMSERIKSPLTPWQKAMEAARIAREVWSLEKGAIENSMLSDVFEISLKILDEPSGSEGPMNAGFRNGEIEKISVFLKNSRYGANRRFALLRIIGDHLLASKSDKLLPASLTSRTQRQKFQRAFAQEFLCPYSELIEYLGSEDWTDDETIQGAADHFGVSPVAVETILVNKGDLRRSFLSRQFLAFSC